MLSFSAHFLKLSVLKSTKNLNFWAHASRSKLVYVSSKGTLRKIRISLNGTKGEPFRITKQTEYRVGATSSARCLSRLIST